MFKQKIIGGIIIAAICVLILGAGKGSILYAVAGQWSSNGNTIYYVDGKVAIGKSNPTLTFEVAGPSLVWPVTGDGNLFIAHSTGNSTNKNLVLAHKNTYALVETFGGVQPLALQVAGNSKLGIGLTNPSQKLHVAGNTLIQGSGGDGDLRIAYASGSWTNKNLILAHKNNHALIETFGSTEPIAMQVGGGKVGIGTISPTHTLSVNGTIKAREVLVTNSNWADYVFEDDYDLKSLNEVEEYINKNNKLPNIPGAAEIELNGIPVGEIQKLQMEKIEELTLYLIEQDKTISELQRQNDELEARLERLERMFN